VGAVSAPGADEPCSAGALDDPVFSVLVAAGVDEAAAASPVAGYP